MRVTKPSRFPLTPHSQLMKPREVLVAGLGTAAELGMDAGQEGITVGWGCCGVGKVAARLGRAAALAGLEINGCYNVCDKKGYSIG